MVIQSFDVAIVGYGPVGATLASLLGQEGLKVALFEREGTMFSQPRAGHFDGEVMRVLQSVGVADEVATQVLINPGMQFVTGTGKLLLDWPRPQHIGSEGWYPSYRFHQPFLESSLRKRIEQLSSVSVFARSEVNAIDEHEQEAVVHFRDLATERVDRVTAKYVVGCDGARSTVKKMMRTSNHDLGSHERWLVIDVKLNQPRPDLPLKTIQWCDPDRPITMANGVQGRRRWEIMLFPGEQLDTAEPEFYWPILARWIKPEEATIERAVVYTFHSVIAETWRRGRLLLAGDACHQTPPFLGQGMCAGIRDAANLSWKLAAVVRGDASESLLDSYQAEREPHVREFIHTALRLGAMIHVTDPAAAAARDARFLTDPPMMQTPQPRLGPGLHGSAGALAGTRSEQLSLDDGQRMDEVLGHRFAVLCRDELALRAQEDFPTRSLAILSDRHAQIKNYLDVLGVAAVVIRPDRFILGTAQTLSELREITARIPVAGRHPT